MKRRFTGKSRDARRLKRFRSMGSKGGKSAAAKLTPEERQEKARYTVQVRWLRYYLSHPEKVAEHKARQAGKVDTLEGRSFSTQR